MSLLTGSFRNIDVDTRNGLAVQYGDWVFSKLFLLKPHIIGSDTEDQVDGDLLKGFMKDELAKVNLFATHL